MSRVDDIFTPERLSHVWINPQNKSNKKEQKKEAPFKISKVWLVFNDLKNHICARFYGEKKIALNIFLDELEKLLSARFPKNNDLEDLKEDETKEEIKPKDSDFFELLNQIEDLIEAYEI